MDTEGELYGIYSGEVHSIYGLPWWLSGKGSTCQCRRHRRLGFNPWVGKIPWRRKWQPTPAFLPEKSHGQRSLVGYSPWSRKESDTTERLHFTSLLLTVAQLVKNPPAMWGPGFDPWIGKIPWKRERLLTPVFLPGKSPGQRSLLGYRPWGRKESNMTEHSLEIETAGCLLCFMCFWVLVSVMSPCR